MKRRDPIINELHRVREDIGKTHDFDVRRITAAIRQHEDENSERCRSRVAQTNDATDEGLVAASSRKPELVHGPQPGRDPVPTGWREGRHITWYRR